MYRTLREQKDIWEVSTATDLKQQYLYIWQHKEDTLTMQTPPAYPPSQNKTAKTGHLD